MTVTVVAVALGRHVDARDDAVAKVRVARHAGVEHRDRDARAVVLGRHGAEPNRIAPGRVGGRARVRVGRVRRRGCGSEQRGQGGEQERC